MKRFNMINEDFICENCGAKVSKSDYTARDHCPLCLYSKHVDINPGDRANNCKGLMDGNLFQVLQDLKKILLLIRKILYQNKSL